jgi:hypothetical protein
VLGAFEFAAIDGEVEVDVWTGLVADQRVDAPPAVQPDNDASLFEGVDDFDYAVGFHAAL